MQNLDLIIFDHLIGVMLLGLWLLLNLPDFRIKIEL